MSRVESSRQTAGGLNQSEPTARPMLLPCEPSQPAAVRAEPTSCHPVTAGQLSRSTSAPSLHTACTCCCSSSIYRVLPRPNHIAAKQQPSSAERASPFAAHLRFQALRKSLVCFSR